MYTHVASHSRDDPHVDVVRVTRYSVFFPHVIASPNKCYPVFMYHVYILVVVPIFVLLIFNNIKIINVDIVLSIVVLIQLDVIGKG